jgi:hypothetical protein
MTKSYGLGQTGGAGPVWKDESIGHGKWLNWSFKDRKTMTSMVSPHLNEFKWVASLWSEVDTSAIPCLPLLDIVIPKLGTKFIKHFTMVFKRVCTFPAVKNQSISVTNSFHQGNGNTHRIEKLLRIMAKDHELKSFTMVDYDWYLTSRHFDLIRTRLENNPKFCQVQHFAVKFTHSLYR